jgi:hypothetical protein
MGLHHGHIGAEIVRPYKSVLTQKVISIKVSQSA